VINTVYFNGKWSTPFTSDGDDEFTNADGTKVMTPFMSSTSDGFGHFKTDDGVESVELPYGGDGRFTMRVFTADDITKAVNCLAKNTFNYTYHDNVKITMPKFEASAELNLTEFMPELDFDFAIGSTLGKIGKTADGTMPTVSGIIQKAYLKVDEAGTEAAAATEVVANGSAAPAAPTAEIKLDKPFVYAIYDMEDNIPLFFGIQNSFE
jgi:serpin B